MKKLLSILAVSSIAVSTPLATIACGKNNEKPTDEWDFEKQKQLMLQLVNSIFQGNLKSDFDPFFYIDENNPAFNHNYIEFAENLADFNDVTSARHESVKTSISNLINWDAITKAVQTAIVENVNFKQLLVNNQSPIKSGYEISELNFALQPESKTVIIDFEITCDVSFKDKIGAITFEAIRFNSKITIFKEVDVAEEFNKIKTEYLNHFNDEIVSGSFTIKSDKGDLKQTSNTINSDQNIKSQVKTNLVEIMNKVGPLGINLLDASLAIETNDKLAVDSTAGEIQPLFSLAESSEQDAANAAPQHLPMRKLVRDALSGVEGKSEEFIKGLLDYSSTSLLVRYSPSGLPSIGTLIGKHEKMSSVFNFYFLNWNYFSDGAQYKQIKLAMDSQESNFKPNVERDEKTIALFRTEISNLQLEYGNDKFDLPTTSIMVRQETLKANTLELEEQFWSDSFYTFKKLVNFDENTQFSNPSLQYHLNKPTGWDQYENQEIPADDYFDDIWAANPEASAIRDNLSLTAVMARRSSALKLTPITTIKFNEKGGIYFDPYYSGGREIPMLHFTLFSNDMSGLKMNGLYFNRDTYKFASSWTDNVESIWQFNK
ncbi:hypothetical protein SSABA_v1c03500 [Spiroplasma sabaudiense Ar-1343]|uniref:Lipoprotein n=1 Tax=Spiroplasma sabaudiense Ar-1343 TaxID=1276257 RepID=W6AJ68_9MOLU|nr:hypothetical protein [Spiroplasma sabaudiense]AHI53759.1 hypothetical protein SSABA_v1c03500 [Spiroplasma sabaudiense Ar-1343]